MPLKWQPPDLNKLIQDYLSGTSEQALAEAYGVSRYIIRRTLEASSVRIRNQHEANLLRQQRSTPEQRAANARAAHTAARGRVMPLSEKIQRAETNARTRPNTSESELELATMLATQGLTVDHQTAIGPYNADLTTSSVAVEVLGGKWHAQKSHGERLRYFLNSGWDVIYVWVFVECPLTTRAAEYIVAHVQLRSRHPTAARCYRVIRGNGEIVAQGSLEYDDIPDKIPVHGRTYPASVPYGFCHCGCGGETAIATTNRRGHRVGEPMDFITGHNATHGANTR